MGKHRQTELIKRLKDTQNQIDNIYSKRDVLHGDSHLYGISIDKPRELIFLESTLKNIHIAIEKNFGKSKVDGFHSVGEILSDKYEYSEEELKETFK